MLAFGASECLRRLRDEGIKLRSRKGVALSDFRGLSRLAFDAAAGLTGFIESMHHNVANAPGIAGPPPQGQLPGISGWVYRGIQGAARMAGSGIDALLAQLSPALGEQSSSPARDAVLSALNGVLGDHLAASGNPLAIRMRLHHAGVPLELERAALATTIAAPTGRVAVLVHGLFMNHWKWERRGHDHGAALARDLGYTPVYLHYNSGLNISTNGRNLADLLEAVVEQWPVAVEELVIIGHSMGGLVSRSAHHYGTGAGHDWPRHLSKLLFLGTPHHGAPLERGGHQLDLLLGKSPYTAALTQFGRMRSAGITDLRYGNLIDEDWQGRDRFEHASDRRRGVPLPSDVQCYAIAATVANEPGDLSDRILGDGLVPLRSALGHHDERHLALEIPDSQQWIGGGMNHLDLLSRYEVYEQIRRWLTPVDQIRTRRDLITPADAPRRKTSTAKRRSRSPRRE
jgi:pimeloyl-ACP methyl ester carboxylesterase